MKEPLSEIGPVRPPLRKISIDLLVPGMYVERIDRSWLMVPVFRNLIESDEQVRRLRLWDVREVVINTEKGTDAAASAAPDLDAPAPAVPPETVDAVPYQEEVAGANSVYEQALRSASRMMDAVRAGQSPDVGVAGATVDRMIASILRNRDALASMTQLKEFSETTFQHCVRVCILSLVFGTRLGFTRADLKTLGMGALLHDVGKMKLPEELINKARPFSNDEFEQYRAHPLLGARLFDGASRIEKASLLVLLQHHERCDGSGFPQGLTEDEISRMAKLVMIVDTYDNLTMGREGGRKLSPSEALKWLREWGSQSYDPALVDEFVAALGLYPAGSLVRLSDNRLAIVISVHHNPAMLPKIWVVFDDRHRLLPEGLELDLGEQQSNRPLTIVSAVVPEKVGFDLPGYVRERGLLTGREPAAHSETRKLS
jgi:HD-GYP domain-containing protein (c-di-GMP phosphodiesterase class II)